MHVLEPKERIKSFEEIEKCFTKEQAMEEANRCLQCVNPECIKGCPAGVNCKEFIQKIREGNMQGALNTILLENPLPCFTSRGCNAEAQCEAKCILGKTGEPISIRALERFAVENSEQKKINGDTGKKKVAIIGSGPAGMAAALELKKKGVNPTIMEMQDNFGGLAVNAIPGYRIPKKVTEEQVKQMQEQGIEMKKNFKVGENQTIGEVLQNFDAVVIATGESSSKKIEVKGSKLTGIISWQEFLKKYSHGNGNRLNGEGKKCVVIGGGDTAMDCARTALRYGYGVVIAYRKNLEFMPCRKKEYLEALEEGIKFEYLLQPTAFIGKQNLEKIKFEKLEIKKEEFVPTKEKIALNADLAVLAIGQEFDESVFKGSIMQGKPLKEEINETELPGVFIAGDAISKNKTIVHAIQSAKNAVKEIQKFLKEGKQKKAEATLNPFDVLLGA